ncbi:MAG: hypothetical protein IJV35_02915 [Neisseriaceae bacterium]|nr:hypothetical protein [Neisseriaceae bacterium]
MFSGSLKIKPVSLRDLNEVQIVAIYVLPLGKTNAARRFSRIALSRLGCR